MFYQNFRDYLAGERKKLDERERMDFPYRRIILKVLAHPVENTKETHPKTYSVTKETSDILVDSKGIFGDRHYGLVRKTTGRECEYPRGTLIGGSRHILAVSPYDCKVLSDKIGVEITPELLGANMVIGREDGKDLPLSELPIATRLIVSTSDIFMTNFMEVPIATLVNRLKQQGCAVTGNAIAEFYGQKELARKFIQNSQDNRGLVLNVEYPVGESSSLSAGQKVFFKFHKGVSV